MNLGSILGLKWKIGAIAGAVALVVASIALFSAQIENRHLLKQNAQLDARINDRSTGYIAQLAQATTNVEQLKVAIDTQNLKLRTQAAESSRKLSALTAEIADIKRDNLKLKAHAAALLATKPQGSTLEQRIRDIDRRNLETLQ